MGSVVKNKLNLLSDIWERYIFEYEYFALQLKFCTSKKPYYVRGVFEYFKDTIEIVFPEKKNEGANYNSKENLQDTPKNYLKATNLMFQMIDYNYSKIFAHHISFLQAIYIQQDLMEELLRVFRTDVERGNLKLDETYSENRDIRNKLVGHPINKRKGELISNTLFSYQGGYSEIQYLIYYKGNCDIKTHTIKDIKLRHEQFLIKYLDIIINKLKDLLCKYLLELEKIEKEIGNGDFKKILELVEVYFEPILRYRYSKEILIMVNKKSDKQYIDNFNKDLKEFLFETKKEIKDILE